MSSKPEISARLNNIIIGIISALLFIPFLGGVHLFDWDEINFAESAREMISSRDYLTVQINFTQFWEKPPLFIWMQVISMKLFGINEFAARFPNAICGIISLLVLFNVGRKVKDQNFGLLWVIFYGGSMLPFFYFKSGIIDPWFNLFIFSGIYFIYRYFEEPGKKLVHCSGSAFFLGLAILTKGPVALLIFILTTGVYLLYRKFKVNIKVNEVLIFIAVLCVTGGFWFILQIMQGNLNIIADFIIYQIRLFKTQDAGHGGFLLYHFVVLFIGVFPASVFALPSLIPVRKSQSKVPSPGIHLWMLLLFWVVIILFTIVRTKIVHYSSLCYFPITFLAAWNVYHLESLNPVWKKALFRITLVLEFVLAIVFTGFSLADQFKEYLIIHQWITDPFAVACLKANGGWKGYEFISVLPLVAGLIMYISFGFREITRKSVIALTACIPLFMFFTMILVVPRVEAYSQRAAIDFFKSVSDKDAYLETIGYKSYAHLFYGQIKDHRKDAAPAKEWLLTGNIDKTAYFSVKINRKEKFMKDYPSIEFLYEENGFVFFKRNKVAIN